MDDGVPIEFAHGGHDAILEFLFGIDTDVAQHPKSTAAPRRCFRHAG